MLALVTPVGADSDAVLRALFRVKAFARTTDADLQSIDEEDPGVAAKLMTASLASLLEDPILSEALRTRARARVGHNWGAEARRERLVEMAARTSGDGVCRHACFFWGGGSTPLESLRRILLTRPADTSGSPLPERQGGAYKREGAGIGPSRHTNPLLASSTRPARSQVS